MNQNIFDKPVLTKEHIESIIAINKIDLTRNPCVLIGIRGYYKDKEQGKNERGIYDDAMFWVTPNVFASFNANCDPSRYQKGFGEGSEKGMASLNPGVWYYKTGLHYGITTPPYPAFRQAAPVVVTRDGNNGNYQSVVPTSINIHRGGINTTGSLGCQTIPPSQWNPFKNIGYSELKRFNQITFPYILCESTSSQIGVVFKA